jgi:hypothetical protein
MKCDVDAIFFYFKPWKKQHSSTSIFFAIYQFSMSGKNCRGAGLVSLQFTDKYPKGNYRLLVECAKLTM